MTLSDLPPAEQRQFLDGITVGIGTREARRPAVDLDALDPWRGDDAGWWWRKGFEIGFKGRDAQETADGGTRQSKPGAPARAEPCAVLRCRPPPE